MHGDGRRFTILGFAGLALVRLASLPAAAAFSLPAPSAFSAASSRHLAPSGGSAPSRSVGKRAAAMLVMGPNGQWQLGGGSSSATPSVPISFAPPVSSEGGRSALHESFGKLESQLPSTSAKAGPSTGGRTRTSGEGAQGGGGGGGGGDVSLRMGATGEWELAGGGAASGGVDVERVRAETRGVGGGRVHLNSAGSALMPARVADSLVGFLREEEERGGYEVAAAREADLNRFYSATARLINCKEGEIAFVDSATRGWCLAFYSIPLKKGDRIITGAADYGSNFVAYLQARDRHGAELVVVPDDASGQIDLDALRVQAAHPRAKVISISHIPTGGGLVNPAAEVGQIAKEFGLAYILDACQSIGQMPVDVHEIGCDVCTATGRKYLRGPRGTGFVYVRDSFLKTLDPVMLDQAGATLLSESSFRPRQDAKVFEMWETYYAGKVALGDAIEYALEIGLVQIHARIQLLSVALRTRLSEIPGVLVTDVGRELCGIVTFTLQGHAAPEVKAALAKKNIFISVSAASGGGSRVWFDRRGLEAVVRVSPHYYNTIEEVTECAAAVASLAAPRSRL